MKKNNFYNQIIHNRLEMILALIKEGKDTARIEREAAFLTLDVLNALQKKEIDLKEGCNCFRKIEFAIDLKLESRLSEEFQDILFEGILLDELGTKYGPRIDLLVNAVKKVLARATLINKIVRPRALAGVKG